MTDVTQLLRGDATPQPQRQAVSGYVSPNKTAPAAFGDPLYVILPTYDPTRTWGPCKWGAAEGSTLPAQGAEVLVIFDDQNVPVVVWWEGSPAFSVSGSAGGVLTGTYPNPGMAAGAAATNVGTLGGDLSGTLPNPTIGAGKVTTSKIATGAVTTNEIADGTIAVGDLATATVQNFLQLLASGTRKLAFFTGSVTFTASTTSANTTFSHGLGATPVSVQITGTDLNTVWWGYNKSSTQITVRGSYASALSASFGFDCIAIA